MEKYLERLIALDRKTNAMLKMDPFAGLVEEVRPLLESVGHISAQTRIYESMQRIPGGPTSFMNLNTHPYKLWTNSTQLHGCEARYRLILAGMNRNMSAIVNKESKGLHEDFITIFGDTEMWLQDYKIYMSPEEGEVPPITTTIESLLYWISQLQRNYENLEALVPEGKVLKLLQGHITISTTGQEGLAKTIHEITLEHGDSTFPQVGFLWSQTIKGINQKMEDIGDHFNRMKVRYEDLANLNSKKIEL